MLKKMLILMFGLFLAVAFMDSTCFAKSKGNDKKGKFTYRQIYKKCKARGEIDKPKPLFNPSDKTQKQWQRIFDKKRFKKLGCEQEWAGLSEDDLENIHAYLRKGAADSPTPAKCQ
ncbi:Cytochrome c family protein [Candidatus Desulfarcum epimagneticum]|uniref:Cytochrome c family protein n=1 Tax=uncultured Desulfobacteraceae bacterium TaxID=218296 RepID=A0A484HMM3_9BACT|nr:Cytochrome c family protein [uncultured Desulfobacteraceae bacterium]